METERGVDRDMRGAKFGAVSSVDTACSAADVLCHDLVVCWNLGLGILRLRESLGGILV